MVDALTPDDLQHRIDALREDTRHADTKASLLLLAPGGALAGAGLLGGLVGSAHTLASMALIVAVAMAAPIGAAIWPRRRSHGAPASEADRLEAIVDAKWRWLRTAIGLGGLALALAAVAVVAAGF